MSRLELYSAFANEFGLEVCVSVRYKKTRTLFRKWNERRIDRSIPSFLRDPAIL